MVITNVNFIFHCYDFEFDNNTINNNVIIIYDNF